MSYLLVVETTLLLWRIQRYQFLVASFAGDERCVRATRHKTPEESSVILQIVIMVQLTFRRIFRD